MGGGAVIGYKRRRKVDFVNESVKTLKRKDLLTNQKSCFRQKIERNVIFQQAIAPIHSADSIK